ncbi:MAG: FAD-dependent oxidoreductase [Chloroflexota bacterium]|nr:FAD-dependent oxidoreductase [Chloroflexota bacterium]
MKRTELLKTKYLIVGNSAGGIGASEAIREVDKVSPITIVSDEPYPAYSRPLISKYLTKERTLDGILFRSLDFYSQNNISSLLDKRIKRLDLESHTAELENDEKIAWEKLLLATGGKPIIPRIEGLSKSGVFSFMTLDDAKAISEFLNSASKAVVIGGGLIGISATEALVKRGIEVTVVEMKQRILNTILDEQGSLMAEEALKQAGVRIIGGHTVSEISGEHSVREIILDNGERISCNLVVVAIGVVPRNELAEGTEIRVNRGIAVDSQMTTSHPDVYSCGDVAEAYDFVYGTDRLTPIWPNAYIGGRIAGYNMSGTRAIYPGGTAMNSLNYFGLDISAAGIAIPPDNDGYEIISKQKDSVYQRVVLKDDLIVGMVFIEEIEKSGLVLSLMRDRVNVSSFKQALLSDDFGMVCLPRELWQERLGVPPLLVYKPTIPDETEDFIDE